jgi:hypothetical protein
LQLHLFLFILLLLVPNVLKFAFFKPDYLRLFSAANNPGKRVTGQAAAVLAVVEAEDGAFGGFEEDAGFAELSAWVILDVYCSRDYYPDSAFEENDVSF